MNDPNELVEVTDPDEIAAIGVPGLVGWINGGFQNGKWLAYRWSLERWRAKAAKLLPALACLPLLTGCTREPPPCERDPQFYLKDTQFDCATRPDSGERT